MALPLVAIPAYHLASGRVSRWRAGGYAVPEPYVDALRRAGVRSAILPEGDDAPAAEILEPFDGLLLVGGGDVEPCRYGADPHPAVYGVEADRDKLELAVARRAVEQGMPVLAVCRGLQLLNVAFGGTLHQHLPDHESELGHGVPVGGPPGMHEVRVAPGTLLAEVCGSGVLSGCTSYHHQAADRIGDRLVATAWSSDGTVEALETAPDVPGWLLAVQWHPEMTAADDPAQQALFDAFGAQLRAAVTATNATNPQRSMAR